MADNIHKISKQMATEIVGKKMKRTSASAWIARECKVCPYCKKEFVPITHTQVTCGAEKCRSAHSYKLSRVPRHEAQCEICGATFMRAANKGSSATRTCSRPCAHKLRKREMAKHILICEKCGKPFNQHAATAKYCTECGRAPQTCAVCGKSFRSRHIGQRTCGAKDCINEHKSRTETTRLRRIATHEPDTFEVDFSQLHTMNSEFPTMDCPECDPLTNRMYENWIVIAQPQPKRKAA